MIRLSIAVMAVPSRLEHANHLLDKLQHQCREARARGHEVGEIGLAIDSAHAGPWANWQRAWSLSSATPGATHHVVLQDDVLPCADLPETLVRLALVRPNDVVSGFLPRASVERARAAGKAWVRCARFLWAQCVMMPVSLGDAALAWVREHEHEADARGWKHHDDVRLADFFRHGTDVRRPVYVTVPNIVEHVGDAIGGSTLGHNGPAAKRRARVWFGEEVRLAHRAWGDLRAEKD